MRNKRKIIIHSKQIKICRLEKGDWQLLQTWLANPVVAQYYEGRDQEITEQFILDHYFNNEDCARCLVYYEEQPIGYMQYYKVEQAYFDSFHYSSDEAIDGMDQLIEMPKFWNKGIGTEMIQLVVHKQVDRIHKCQTNEPYIRMKRSVLRKYVNCSNMNGMKKTGAIVG